MSRERAELPLALGQPDARRVYIPVTVPILYGSTSRHKLRRDCHGGIRLIDSAEDTHYGSHSHVFVEVIERRARRMLCR
jgi:hypothetical protein